MLHDPNSPFQYLQLEQIKPSRTNPRKRFPEDKMKELAENIKANGVMQPILVRPVDKHGKPIFGSAEAANLDHYEIVAGERRYRASKMADQPGIPAVIRELYDLDTLQLQIYENLHREDLHAIEEAEGFQYLLDKSNKLIGMTVDQLAEKIGKSRSYIFASLKLLNLCTYGRDVFYDGKIGKEIAILIGRIPGEALQTQAIKEIIRPNYHGDGMSFRAAAAYIRDRFTLDLNKAPFDRHSAALCETAGSCLSCPKRSGNYPELFPDIESPDVCTDPDCFGTKKAAHIVLLKESGRTILEGEEAKQVAPYGVGSYVTGGYCSAGRYVDLPGLNGTYEEILGDDLPDPVLLIDDKNEIAEIYPESLLRQKLQEKIDAGELVLEPQNREPAEWEIKRDRRNKLIEEEREYRRQLFEALHHKLSSTPPFGIPSTGILTAAIERLYTDIDTERLAILQNAHGCTNQDDADFLAEKTKPGTQLMDLLSFLLELLALHHIEPEWDWTIEELDSESTDNFTHLLDIADIDVSDVLTASQESETASTSPSAAQAQETIAQTNDENPLDESSHSVDPEEQVQASGEPDPAAQTGDAKPLPDGFAKAKAKTLARKAKEQKQKVSATADVSKATVAAASV